MEVFNISTEDNERYGEISQLGGSYPVHKIRPHILCILEAPLANVETFEPLADQFIGVKGRVPCFEVDVTKDNAADVEVGILAGGIDGYAVRGLRGGDGRHGAHS